MDKNLPQLTATEAIRATLAGCEFEYDHPPEMTDALEAGIVTTGNDRWMRSDAAHRANFMTLTPAGWALARSMGLIPQAASTERNAQTAPSASVAPEQTHTNDERHLVSTAA